MIEEADQLEGFLPISYRTPKEEEYVRFLWEAFHDNCASGKYQFEALHAEVRGWTESDEALAA